MKSNPNNQGGSSALKPAPSQQNSQDINPESQLAATRQEKLDLLAQHIQRKSASPFKMNDEILDNLHDEYDNEDEGDYGNEQAEGLEHEDDPSCLQ